MTPPRPQRPGAHAPDASPPARTPFEALPDDEAPSQDAGSRPQSGPQSQARHATTEFRSFGPKSSPAAPGFGQKVAGEFSGTASSASPYPSPEVPEAERTVADPPAAVPQTAESRTTGPEGNLPPWPNTGPGTGSEPPIPEAERTVTDEVEDTGPASDAPATPPFTANTGGPATPPINVNGTSAPAAPFDVNGDVGSEAKTTTTGLHNGTSRSHADGRPSASDGSGGSDGTWTLALAPLDRAASSNASGPELEPDAILPPGTPPEAPPEPPHDPNATSTGPIPRLTAGAGFRRPRGGSGGSSAARRAMLVGGGLVGALVLGGAGALAVTTLSGGHDKDHKVAQTRPAPTPTAPTPTPSPSRTKAKHRPKKVPVDIRDEKKDPKPLTIAEVFPTTTLTLDKQKFNRVKTVINDHCSLAASGPFATELTREHCRRIVRATFVSDDKKIAVTTGIAVMPTDAAARALMKVQDPSHYKWFRGMKATGAPKIDGPGGVAASTTRGRYIAYAYVMYADAHKPASGDDTLKDTSNAFRDSTVRPIERRAKH